MGSVLNVSTEFNMKRILGDNSIDCLTYLVLVEALVAASAVVLALGSAEAWVSLSGERHLGPCSSDVYQVWQFRPCIPK